MKDIFFPTFCVGCASYGAWVCNTCTQGLKRHSQPVCLQEERGICFALYSYEDPLIRQIVHQHKYDGFYELSDFMASGMSALYASFMQSGICHQKNCVLVPIPLYPKKLQENGWNHAEKIAVALSGLISVPVDSASLRRTKDTLSQASLSRKERIKNVSGAFECYTAENLDGKTVLLIDDVMTTGSTVREAARALRNKGVQDIYALVFAHGSAT